MVGKRVAILDCVGYPVLGVAQDGVRYGIRVDGANRPIS